MFVKAILLASVLVTGEAAGKEAVAADGKQATAARVAGYYERVGLTNAAAFYRQVAARKRATARRMADYYERTGRTGTAEFYRQLEKVGK